MKILFVLFINMNLRVINSDEVKTSKKSYEDAMKLPLWKLFHNNEL